MPVDAIIIAAQSSGGLEVRAVGLLKTLRLPRLIRLMKMFRLFRLQRIFERSPELVQWLQYSRWSNFWRLGRIVVSIVLIMHYMCCVFNMVMDNGEWLEHRECGYEKRDVDFFSGDAETARLEASEDGRLADSLALRCSDAPLYTKYVTAMYYSMLLVSGEEIFPSTQTEILTAVFMVLFGSVMLATIFGNIALLISNFTTQSSEYQRKMSYLFETMNHLELPQGLKMRIISYYDQMWKNYRSLDGSVRMFLPELNETLSSEVFLFMRTEMILTVPFLRSCSPDVVRDLVMTLREEVFLKGDYIVNRGVPGREMYLITHGECEATITELMVDPNAHAPKEKRLTTMQKRRQSVVNAVSAVRRSSAAILSGVVPGQRGSLNAGTRKSFGKSGLPSSRSSFVRKGSDSDGADRNSKLNGALVEDEPDSAQTPLPPKPTVGGRLTRMAEMAAASAGVGNPKPQGSPGGGRKAPSLKDMYAAEKIIANLKTGDYFGEIALLMHTKRTCNVRAVAFCEMCVLTRIMFDKVMEKYEEDRRLMEEMIIERYKTELHGLKQFRVQRYVAEEKRVEAEHEARLQEQKEDATIDSLIGKITKKMSEFEEDMGGKGVDMKAMRDRRKRALAATVKLERPRRYSRMSNGSESESSSDDDEDLERTKAVHAAALARLREGKTPIAPPSVPESPTSSGRSRGTSESKGETEDELAQFGRLTGAGS